MRQRRLVVVEVGHRLERSEEVGDGVGIRKVLIW